MEFSQVGDVSFTTRAGNAFHGRLFEYLQNDALDARILNFDVKVPKHYKTFGGSVGGQCRIHAEQFEDCRGPAYGCGIVPRTQDHLALSEEDVKKLLLLMDTQRSGKISKQEWKRSLTVR